MICSEKCIIRSVTFALFLYKAWLCYLEMMKNKSERPRSTLAMNNSATCDHRAPDNKKCSSDKIFIEWNGKVFLIVLGHLSGAFDTLMLLFYGNLVYVLLGHEHNFNDVLSIYSRGTLWELAVELGTGSFTLFFFFFLSGFFFFFYCSRFCHTLKWISHGFTCVPHPDRLLLY